MTDNLEKIELTDINAAVYRPWAWVQIGESEELRINFPRGLDEKFRWLKQFRWSYFGNNQGSSVEFTIYEDRSGWNLIWPGIVAKNVFANIEDCSRQNVYFQFGYEGRGIDGNRISDPSSVGGTRTKHSSSIHCLSIYKMDVEFIQGGISYKFVGQDQFAFAGNWTTFEFPTPLSFREAFKQLCELRKKQGLLSDTWDPEPHFSDDFEQKFDVDTPNNWPGSGYPFLLTVQKWTSELHYKENNNLKDHEKVGPCMIPVVDKDTQYIQFKPSYSTIPKNKALFEIHVNPPEGSSAGEIESGSGLGPGKHTALSIRPTFSGDYLWSLFPQITSQDTMTRSVGHQIKSDGKLGESGQGGQATVVAKPLDSPRTFRQNIINKMGTIIGTAGNNGALYIPIKLEVDLLGIPNLDDILYIGEYVIVYIWNTSYISDELKWRREARIPSEATSLFPPGSETSIFGSISGEEVQIGTMDSMYYDFLDRRFSGSYLISGIAHVIDDSGAYKTTLSLSADPSDINLKKEEEGSSTEGGEEGENNTGGSNEGGSNTGGSNTGGDEQ
jgi:hypothetical protein